MAEGWVFAQRASWLRLLPARAIWRLRSRSAANAGAVQSLGPRHRHPQQRGGRHASRRRLLLPGGVLRPRDAGGDHDGAPLSHERTGPGVRGTASPVRVLPRQRREKAGGSKGGAASPSPEHSV